LMGVFPPWQRPHYEPSKRTVTFHNGAKALTYSGFEPDQLRGGNHDLGWGDEIASWQYPQETYDMMRLAVRLGLARKIFTTTPKPIRLLKQLKEDGEQRRNGVVLTVGSTYDNALNLSPQFFQEIVKQYEGTTLGQQELYAALLSETPGALLKREHIERSRVRETPRLKRIVVAIDPAATD